MIEQSEQKTRTVETGQVRFTTDFTCGAGESLRQLRPDHLALSIPADPDSIEVAKGYDYFFCASLSNRTPEHLTFTVDAKRPDAAGRETRWQPSRVPVFISEDFRSWYVMDQSLASENHEEYQIIIPLHPHQSIYLSNSLPCPSASMASWLKRIAEDPRRKATLTPIGHSVQGREILLLTLGESGEGTSGKDRILVTSGLHPAEADWLITTAIIEELLRESSWSARVLREFVIDIVVQANPDGFDLGKNGCNARGVNLYWDFRADDGGTSPEAVCLWRWIQDHPPSIYLDFHSYVHQLHKDFRPYIRPLVDYPRPAQPLARRINRRLISLCEGRLVRGKSTNEPTTLAAQITKSFGTITYTKFHTHLNHGVEACRRLGLDVFRAVVDEASRFRPLAPRTVQAVHRPSSWDRLRQRIARHRMTSKLRSLEERVRLKLGSMSQLSKGLVATHRTEGLREHWRSHLWSGRDHLPPVIVLDDPVGTRSRPASP